MSWQDDNRTDLLCWLASPASWLRERGIDVQVVGDAIHLTRTTRQGFPLRHSQLRLTLDDWEFARALVEGEAETMLRKPGDRVVAGQTKQSLSDPRFMKEFPNLWEYMTADKYEDGTPRVPSSLLVFWDQGELKGMLRDKDAGLCLWVSAHAVFDLLTLFELKLGDPSAEWREDRVKPGQPAKRVQRRG